MVSLRNTSSFNSNERMHFDLRGTTVKKSRWSALDPTMCHPLSGDEQQKAASKSTTTQFSTEQIVIRDSADVEVHTTDTQAAVALQAAIQAGISLIVNISVADSNTAEQITQELFQQANITQNNFQITLIENSKNVKVTTTDTDLAVSIQVLLQILVALAAELDIL
jgi:spore coat protein X